MPQEKSAGAIIFRMIKGVPHYLLLRYPSKHWEFAKGHIEPGESLEKTVRREVQEETGITDLKIIPGFKKYSKYFFKKHYHLSGAEKKKAPWVFKLVTFYLAETRTEIIVLSPEHLAFAWLPIKEALKKTTFKNAKELLKQADAYLLLRKKIPYSLKDREKTESVLKDNKSRQ